MLRHGCERDDEAQFSRLRYETHETEVPHLRRNIRDASKVEHSVLVGGSYSAVSPRSSLRMRMASSILLRKILPSPMRPVRAEPMMAWMVFSF